MKSSFLPKMWQPILILAWAACLAQATTPDWRVGQLYENPVFRNLDIGFRLALAPSR
jgi:hypothetical protein